MIGPVVSVENVSKNYYKMTIKGNNSLGGQLTIHVDLFLELTLL